MRSLVIIFFIFAFCSCTRSVTVRIMKPAPLTIPHRIQSLAILNRTLPENKKANVLESVLTGEMPFQDKQAVEATLQGLSSSLNESSRFQVKMANVQLQGSGSGGNFPPALSWEMAQKIGKDYGTDAVLALETFDSDFIVTSAEKITETKDDKGNVSKVKTYKAEGVATVKLGFRLYDLQQKSIMDQYHYSKNGKWTASGRTVAAAVAALIGQNQAVIDVSGESGYVYAKRIVPSYIRVSREYYKKKGKEMMMRSGARKAAINDWDGAIADWKKAAERRNPKIAGRAAFNIALGYEILGELDNAVNWAQRSYADFGLRKGINYYNILRNRKRDQEILEQQQ